MKAGVIVTHRLNPKDVMAVIDVLHHIGVDTANLSFNQATKIVLASALESFRQQGMIPERSGFEYSTMLAPFQDKGFGSRAAKLKIAGTLNRPDAHVAPVVPDDPERAKRRRLYEELLIRKNSGDGWTDEDQQVFAPLLEEFYS